jgi:hypothetical protein
VLTDHKLFVSDLKVETGLADDIADYSREIGLPKTSIARLALREWAERHIYENGEGAPARG